MTGKSNTDNSSKIPVLIVDDEESTRIALSKLLSKENLLPICAASAEEALALHQRSPVDIIISDLKLPNMSGIDLLKEIKKRSPSASVILITGYGSIENAVAAMKAGAYDYIIKPLKFDELLKIVFKAIEKFKLVKENIYLKEQLYGKFSFDSIIGKSLPMQEVFSLMEKVSDSDCTILIQGASGTGKELVARAIHYNSSLKDNKFVTINCGAIPRDLLESELFGHEKGAFTGAVSSKVGKFEYANGGTVFLDEIGNMSMDLQMKLLRVLQEREIERVGSTKTKKINVRVLSATNVNLKNAITRGHFREDLYYRLNVVQVNLPPLKDRIADVPLLVKHFLKKQAAKSKKKGKTINDSALKQLLEYSYPGNVRELENIIERAIILCDDSVIAKKDLPEHVKNPVNVSKPTVVHFEKDIENGIDLNKEVIEFEHELILNALKFHKGTKSKAAKSLNINRTTLVEKLKRMNNNKLN